MQQQQHTTRRSRSFQRKEEERKEETIPRFSSHSVNNLSSVAWTFTHFCAFQLEIRILKLNSQPKQSFDRVAGEQHSTAAAAAAWNEYCAVQYIDTKSIGFSPDAAPSDGSIIVDSLTFPGCRRRGKKKTLTDVSSVANNNNKKRSIYREKKQRQ